MSSSGSSRRLFFLDLLRGVAVLLVVFRHAPQPSPGEGFLSDQALLFSKVMYRIGWCGVDLFFVLSGFLISTLLFREIARTGSLRFPRFWLRRGFKIWPSYFVAYGGLTLLLIASSYRSDDTERAQTLAFNALPNLIFVQNYFPMEMRWRHSWSLAIEEQFYTVLPLLLLAGLAWPALRNRIGMKTVLTIFVVAFSSILAMRLIAIRQGGDWTDLYYPTHLRCDGLLFGVFIGYLRTFRTDYFQRWAAISGHIIIVGLPIVLYLLVRAPLQESTFMQGVGFTILYLYFGNCVVWAAETASPTQRTTWGLGPIERIGFYSYTIYLAHSVVLEWPGYEYPRSAISWLMGGSSWAGFVTFCVMSVLGGVVLSKLIELPFLRWRDKILASNTSVA